MKKQFINFSKFSSIKIGGELEVFILENCTEEYKNFYMIGACNNILIGTQAPMLMKLSKRYDYIEIQNDFLKIGAATPSGKITSFCKKNNIADFEFLSHLPGTLGGLVFMNAGLKEYEIFNNLVSINTCEGCFKRDEVSYGYRFTDIKTPILEAVFDLKYGFSKEKLDMFEAMRLNQPSNPSAGSCFKNPRGDYAGRLIEAVGLKGFRVGGVEFSKQHANFLLNIENGTFDEAIFLIQEAQKRVYDKFKIWLECEIKVLDKRFMGEDSPLLNPFLGI